MLGQSPAGKWETEVFLLRGENRGELLESIRALADYLKRTPSVELLDLAFTLNTRIRARGRCLAIVAGSPTDLHARLERAASRLGDPACRQINGIHGGLNTRRRPIDSVKRCSRGISRSWPIFYVGGPGAGGSGDFARGGLGNPCRGDGDTRPGQCVAAGPCR